MSKKCNSTYVKQAAATLAKDSSSKTAKSKAGTTLANHKHNHH